MSQQPPQNPYGTPPPQNPYGAPPPQDPYGTPPPQNPYGAPPAGPYGGGAWSPPPPPASKAQAVWALVLAIVPIPLAWIAAVVLAVVVLRRSAREQVDRGRGLAIGALVVVGAWLLLAVLVVGLAVLGLSLGGPDRGDDGRIVDEGTVGVFDLREGDCLDDAGLDALTGTGEQQFTSLDAVPCSAPHRAEVFALQDLDGDVFPGNREVIRASQQICTPAFGDFVGVPYARSELDYLSLYPTAQSWEQLDDREVVCLAVDPAGPTRGSLADAGR